MITIVLADDHRIVRRGIKMLLDAEKDFQVVGEASDSAEAAKLVESMKPEILVTDLHMDGMSGFDLIEKTIRYSPMTGVVVLSMHAEPAYVLKSLQSGAKGYVLKEASPDELPRAIRAVISGDLYLSPPLSQEKIEAYRRSVQPGD